VTEKRKYQHHQKPPEGFIFATDFEDEETGTVIVGIASRLGLNPHTYKKWRMAGIGPHYRKHGKRIIARPEWIDAWMSEQDRATGAPKIPTAA
jgi:hypothetical protein